MILAENVFGPERVVVFMVLMICMNFHFVTGGMI
jgi:hypothetical protein